MFVSLAVVRFFERASGPSQKIGTILFQLPPGLKINPERLSLFLDRLPPGYRYVFEFRNAGWFHPEFFPCLEIEGPLFAYMN